MGRVFRPHAFPRVPDERISSSRCLVGENSPRLGIRIGTLEDNLIEQPIIALDEATLDAADGR